jgi:phosphoribosylformylglycinamidine cyclo-ligase
LTISLKTGNYKSAGVDIEAGDAAVELMATHVRSTHTPQVLSSSHGGFGGMFQLDYPPGLLRRNYKNPVLVASTDGVGTKLEIAYRTGIADTVGIDLVAMCVNDIIVQGAEPLFFLDYIAVGKLKPWLVAEVVKGIAAGCREAGCSILGGETAEMPGFYPNGHYELAGFAVGVVEKRRLILGRSVTPGDQIIGLLSTGVHSNGFSLVRKIFPNSGSLKETPRGLDAPLGQTLLEPTRIYVKPILSILRAYRMKKVVHAIAHITGGGLPGNIPRVLPPRVDAVIRRNRWQVPPIFKLIQQTGKVSDQEMFRVFNMGIGLVLVVSPHFLDSILGKLAAQHVPAAHIGEIVKGSGRVRLNKK